LVAALRSQCAGFSFLQISVLVLPFDTNTCSV
jgi:hypothetical protein